MRRLGVAGAVLVLALTGCGGRNGDAAAAEVQKKQEALDQARADLAKAGDEFCGDAKAYVTALDRYGDVLTRTAPTVGDVTEAGADLAEPREDVIAAAEQVKEAKDAVATAEQELAAAKRAQTSASAASSPAASPSTGPSLAPATIDRVKQADADFAAAQQGISAQTPIRQASERFNAAAVALEMAWIRVLDEAGCLDESHHDAARDYTLALQKSLAAAGYYEGEIDGVYGPTTVSAVEALQKKNGLPVTGTVDKATDAALQAELAAKGGQEAQQATASTAAVQQTLKLAGHWTGPVDGVWTPELTGALKEFQTELQVEPTGTVDAATIAAVENAVKETGPTPSTSS
ncbi:peptidoglycan-binding domain-containing protein [Actinoplanes sp. CA-030573]|uniref:peptidoglycan-binding domain-containing protein n=1 Tax=Actinoplanes sp. CA-030573 TaxID=3239898 RepID=UPI003D8B1F98